MEGKMAAGALGMLGTMGETAPLTSAITLVLLRWLVVSIHCEIVLTSCQILSNADFYSTSATCAEVSPQRGGEVEHLPAFFERLAAQTTKLYHFEV